MTTDRISSRAPTRIDLAGGTLDIWPLYTFLQEPLTVNAAINIDAESCVSEDGTPGVTLESRDQKTLASFEWCGLDTAATHPSLELHLKLLRHFARLRTEAGHALPSGIRISTLARSPAGAGIGGSSAVNIALTGALAKWSGCKPEPDQLIRIARDIETTVIQVPAGMQDYYASMYGGLLAISWQHGGIRHRTLPAAALDGLGARMLLFYSGQSRNSGINNWAVFKSFIDDPQKVRPLFEGIAACARGLAIALECSDWNGCSRHIAEEWQLRKRLAPGITTAVIDRAFEIAAQTTTSCGKACGAGGGGCFFVFLPAGDPAALKSVSDKIMAELGRDIRKLEFSFSPAGLQVTQDAGQG